MRIRVPALARVLIAINGKRGVRQVPGAPTAHGVAVAGATALDAAAGTRAVPNVAGIVAQAAVGAHCRVPDTAPVVAHTKGAAAVRLG